MVVTDTLVIRNLPSCLSGEEKKQLLKYFGATNIKIFDNKYKKKGIAFAKFESEEVASVVLSRLHQKDLFGQTLVVEFVDKDSVYSPLDNSANISKEKQTEEEITYEKFIEQLNNWTKGLQLDLPPPCHLKYQYPAASASTLHNIVNMIAAVPKLYTQVLHLMNKMNLPSPFEPSFVVQHSELFTSFISYIREQYPVEVNETSSSSEVESELESDTDVNIDKNVTFNKAKRKTALIRSVKRPKKVKPTSYGTGASKTKSMEIKDLFDSINERIMQKKIEVKVPDKICESVVDSSSVETESSGFGVISRSEKVAGGKSNETKAEESNEETLKPYTCITAEKLAVNRIPERDFAALPVFKNYQAGNPSCRLYIKNLSKQVVRDDLTYIYGRYFDEETNKQGTMFDVRLMQEGRMKGQAFITLQNVEKAKLALKETNGYILKDKPMVVQFARSAPAN